MSEITIEQLKKMTAREIAEGLAKDNLYFNPPPPMPNQVIFPQRDNIWYSNLEYSSSGVPVFNRSTPPPLSTSTTSTTTTSTTISPTSTTSTSTSSTTTTSSSTTSTTTSSTTTTTTSSSSTTTTTTTV